MAATAVSAASAVDFKAQNSFPVRLGNSISKPDGSSRFSSVRYNHKPSLAGAGDVSCKLLPGGNPEERILSLRSGQKEWKYAGSRREEVETFVLVFGREGRKEAMLERLADAYAVNLTQSPDGADTETLAKRFPPLPGANGDGSGGNDDDGLFGEADEGEDDVPDPDNPFDYRHFLKAAEAKAQAQREEAASHANRSLAGTPVLKARLQTNTAGARLSKPAPAAAAKKRKAPGATAAKKSIPKRVQAGHSPPAKSTKPQPKANPPSAVPSIPEVRLDRKASTVASYPQAEEDDDDDHDHDHDDNDDDDNGELILENESPVTHKNSAKHRSMGLALSGAFGGPRSLHSAASMSPASRINSPRPEQPCEGEEFEFGVDEGEADEEDEDGDVEDLELPSPVQEQRPREQEMASDDVGVEEEDDMEAQLALAMAQEEDEEPAPVSRLEESEEDVSEEE